MKLNKDDFEVLLHKFGGVGKKDSGPKEVVIPASTPSNIDPASIALWNKGASIANDLDELFRNFIKEFDQTGGVQFLIKVKVWIQEL